MQYRKDQSLREGNCDRKMNPSENFDCIPDKASVQFGLSNERVCCCFQKYMAAGYLVALVAQPRTEFQGAVHENLALDMKERHFALALVHPSGDCSPHSGDRNPMHLAGGQRRHRGRRESGRRAIDADRATLPARRFA